MTDHDRMIELEARLDCGTYWPLVHPNTMIADAKYLLERLKDTERQLHDLASLHGIVSKRASELNLQLINTEQQLTEAREVLKTISVDPSWHHTVRNVLRIIDASEGTL